MIPSGLAISGRISSIVNEIGFTSMADIGCDHGLISIHALESGKVRSAIACDLNTGPIRRAMTNICKYSVNEIQIRQCFGLDMLAPGEAETVVIAGMGGMLILEILNRAALALAGVKQLVLQPQHDIPEVRKYIHSIGFYIYNETMLKDEGRFYNIIDCRRGKDSHYSEPDYLLGKILIERGDGILWEYLTKEITLLESAAESIKNAGTTITVASSKRLGEIEHLLSMYRGLIACRSEQTKL